MPRGVRNRSFRDRFWDRVDAGDPNECWPWLGGRHADGYGHTTRDYTSYRAHRIALELAAGFVVPAELMVLHRCDKPLCCNPAHLFVGTHADNMADRNAKRRHAHGESHGLAQLTAGEVRGIRSRHTELVRTLADEHGISRSNVRRIVSRRAWKSLLEEEEDGSTEEPRADDD